MTRTWKMLLMTGGALAALSGGTALHAQSDKSPNGSTTMQGGSGDMMAMMSQMSAMMEHCNAMMQSADKPAAKAEPEQRK